MTIVSKDDKFHFDRPLARVAAPLREQVMHALRQAILDFQFKPGQRLVERELIELLGVSRTTVREALRELTAEGLVTVVPQKGAIVSAPAIEEAMDLYDVRASLEALIVERFVERASQSQVIQLDAAVEKFAEITEDPASSIHDLLQAKDDLFEILVAGAGSESLRQVVEGIQARVRILRATSLSASGRTRVSVDELREIVSAVRDRDGARAARLYAEHIRSAADAAIANLK
ncbi:GntR family transcriptional regulator [Leifsonia kafniensis]|uniref:GntR family transcriptional regulator n=1 Tax=Leifsonia kafniensis TaxID=475957 RepID=A0ABP7KSF1_9MICO